MTFEQGLGDDRMNAVCIAKHIVIPEAEQPIAFRFDQSGPFGVGRSIVLAAVAFDHQPRAMACEVDDKTPKRHLTTKSSLREGLPEKPPHGSLGISRI